MSVFSMESHNDTIKESGLESDSSSDEEDIHSIFTAIIDKINYNKINLHDPEESAEFVDKYGYYLGESTSEENEGKTLMHMLVEPAKDQFIERYEPLVRLIMRRHPDILEESDSRVNETPLYCAISKKRNQLVRLMCNTHTDINSVLRITCSSNKDTCVHAAIRKSVALDLALFLISKASEEVLCLQDSDGNTPLHIAVEYKRCTNEQLQILELLAKQCKESMHKRSLGEACLSPYLYHMRTRENVQPAAPRAEVPKEKEEGIIQGKTYNVGIANEGSLTGKENQGSTLKTDYREKMEASGGVGGQRMRTLGNLLDKHSPMNPLSSISPRPSIEHGPLSPSRGDFRGAQSTLAMNKLSREKKDDDPKPTRRQDTNPKKGRRLKRKKKQDADELPQVTKDSADAVKDLLMLHCMRTMTTQDAVDFLYGKEQGEFPLLAHSSSRSFIHEILTAVVVVSRKRDLFRFVRPAFFRDYSGSNLSRFRPVAV